MLAFTSSDHYRRIEQGRAAPSAELLRRLTEVLRLNPDQQNYVYTLQAVEALPQPIPQTQPDSLEILIARLPDVAALVISPFTKILFWNDSAVALLGDIGRIPLRQRTYMSLLFAEPGFQARFINLGQMQEFAVGVVRSASATTAVPDEERDQIEALLRSSPAFKSLWDRRIVAYPKGSLHVPMRHPTLGEIPMRHVVLQSLEPSANRLITFIPETAD